MTGQPPIPPSCSTLTLHLYLVRSQIDLNSLKTQADLKADHLRIAESFKEAKRRLQICSIRILDPEALTSMKEELTSAYDRLMRKPGQTSNQQQDPRTIKSEQRTKRPERTTAITHHSIYKAKSQYGIQGSLDLDKVSKLADDQAVGLSTSTVKIGSRQDNASCVLAQLEAVNSGQVCE